jgi:hypothetical protein
VFALLRITSLIIITIKSHIIYTGTPNILIYTK